MLKIEVREVRKTESAQVKANKSPQAYSTPCLVRLGAASTLVQGRHPIDNWRDANGFYRINR